MSVILAGHETTAAELAWAFQLLAHDRGVQRELVDDLSAGGERYLNATVYEVLRHRPVFLTCIPRVVNAPYEIGGTQLPRQAHVVGCIHLMHHDPRHYEHPERFDPRRFLDASPPADVWMPWGGGLKLCPGRHLALRRDARRPTLRARQLRFAAQLTCRDSALAQRDRDSRPWLSRGAAAAPHASCPTE